MTRRTAQPASCPAPPGHARRDDGAAGAVPAGGPPHPARPPRPRAPGSPRPLRLIRRGRPQAVAAPGRRPRPAAAAGGGAGRRARLLPGRGDGVGLGRGREHHDDRGRLAPQRGRHPGPGGRGRDGQPGPARPASPRHRQPGAGRRARRQPARWSRCSGATTTSPPRARGRRTAGPARIVAADPAETAAWRPGSGWTRATKLPLRRETFDTGSALISEDIFIDLSLGAARWPGARRERRPVARPKLTAGRQLDAPGSRAGRFPARCPAASACWPAHRTSAGPRPRTTPTGCSWCRCSCSAATLPAAAARLAEDQRVRPRRLLR